MAHNTLFCPCHDDDLVTEHVYYNGVRQWLSRCTKCERLLSKKSAEGEFCLMQEQIEKEYS